MIIEIVDIIYAKTPTVNNKIIIVKTVSSVVLTLAPISIIVLIDQYKDEKYYTHILSL